MRIVTWNVNGIRACMKKGFMTFFHGIDADLFCIQETKLQPGQLIMETPGYTQYWHFAQKKGYSGTAVFAKRPPENIVYGLPEDLPLKDLEGRVMTLEYSDFYLVNVYTPNAQRDLARLDYRMEWERVFRGYLCDLEAYKPVIVCGDLNVAHREIDLKNPQSNRRNAGFTDEEREQMDQLLHKGYIDSFRDLYPEQKHAYTWWSYMHRARERNAGWRIDYIILSASLADTLQEVTIHDQVHGSDHCPVSADLTLSLDQSQG